MFAGIFAPTRGEQNATDPACFLAWLVQVGTSRTKWVRLVPSCTNLTEYNEAAAQSLRMPPTVNLERDTRREVRSVREHTGIPSFNRVRQARSAIRAGDPRTGSATSSTPQMRRNCIFSALSQPRRPLPGRAPWTSLREPLPGSIRSMPQTDFSRPACRAML